jgi:hypothetical protein
MPTAADNILARRAETGCLIQHRSTHEDHPDSSGQVRTGSARNGPPGIVELNNTVHQIGRRCPCPPPRRSSRRSLPC